MKLNKIGVAGAGAMGSGIPQVFAQAGYDVVLYDLNVNQLSKAQSSIEKNLEGAVVKGKLTESAKKETIARITYSEKLESLQTDMVLEAIVERLDAKVDLFQKLSSFNGKECILASNTSSIPITRIAAGIPHPQRVVGMHFFNPAHIMKLVEIISGAETSDAVVETLVELCKQTGKTSILCKDSPGFIVNRVARHYYVESLKLAEEKVANYTTIDTLMESCGFKMGPFKLMDHVGNDINFSVTSSLFESFHQEPKFRPSRLQQQKVDARHLGKKTGKGFYQYD